MPRNLRAINNLDVSGSLKVTGSTTMYGDVTLGDNISDNIFVSGALKNEGGASLTGSFSGSGANLNQLTSSNISNFTGDVRNKISGVGVISYNPSTGEISYTGAGGTIYTDGNITGSGGALDPIRTKENITGSSITASVGVSASYYYGDGSNLTGLPNPDLSGYATLTGVSASFTTPAQVSGAISGSDRPTRVEVTGALGSYLLSSTAASTYAAINDVSSSFGLKTDISSSFASLGAVNTFTAASNIFNNDVTINGTASIAQLNTVNQQSLVIGDKYITILSGSSTHVQMDGAGILFGSGSTDSTSGDQSSVAHIVYRKGNAPTDFISDYIEVYPSLRTPGVLSGSNLTGSNTGDETTATIKSKLGTAGAASEGYLTQTDWNTFNNKQNAITLTTTGTTGSATLVGSTLNIPHYVKTIPPIAAGEIKRGFFFQNAVTTVTTTNIALGGAIDTLRAQTIASTTALTRVPSVQVYRGAGPAEGTVGYRTGGSSNLWLYNNTGGFRFVCGYAPSDGEGSGGATNNTTKNANASQFIGFTTASAAIGISATVSPSSILNIIGFGSDVGDDYWYFMHNDASGVATKVLLEASPGAGGATFGQANKATGEAFTDFFEFEIYNPPNSSIVYYRAKSHENNVEVYGSASTNMPSNTTFLGFQAVRASGGSTVAHSCRLSQIFATSLY